MHTPSPGDARAIAAIAQHHGFSAEAAASMLESLIAGGGAMAQFAHPEFGGSGQWMRGGMTMVGDMFNHQLKARVDALCAELSQLLAARPDLQAAPAGQWQRQGNGTVTGDWREGNGRWWPQELGAPASAGAQNGMRYAYFPDQRRLALDRQGSVTVHDTLDHRIGGFSQQQGGSGSISLSSQHGPVDLDRLPMLWRSGPQAPGAAGAAQRPVPSEPPARPKPEARGPQAEARMPRAGAETPRAGAETPRAGAQAPRAEAQGPGAEAAEWPKAAGQGAGADVLALIERLADLHHKGILSDEEFQAKKAELLARL